MADKLPLLLIWHINKKTKKFKMEMK